MVKDAHTPGSGHPIPVAVARLDTELADLADVPAWSLSLEETRSALVALTRVMTRAAELEARLLTHADAFDDDSVAAWLATATRSTRLTARGHTRLASALTNHDTVRDAMAAGHVIAEQAGVICSAVDALPDQPDLRERCEKHLVQLAEHHDAKDLKILGRRVLEVVDPDAADAHEAALLEKEEKDAAKATSFSMWEPGDGTVKGKFTLPALEGGMLRKALSAIAAPKHQRANGDTYDHERPTHDRLGQAFAEYVSRYPVDKLPHTGGINATVVVTMTLETLLGGLASATTDTGSRLSAGAVRRLACEAGLVPMVLDGASRPLDVGRTRRFHTEAQRLALAVSQKHCQHPTCTVPAWLCHVHHTTPWTRGGKTNTTDARLLCPRHHALTHRTPPTTPMRT